MGKPIKNKPLFIPYCYIHVADDYRDSGVALADNRTHL